MMVLIKGILSAPIVYHTQILAQKIYIFIFMLLFMRVLIGILKLNCLYGLVNHPNKYY